MGCDGNERKTCLGREGSSEGSCRRLDSQIGSPGSWDADEMHKVTIYTASLCPYCHMAKQLLRTKGIGYVEIDVTGQAELRAEMSAKAGRSTVPQIWIGQIHVGGCDDLYCLDRAGKLDELLTT